MFPSWALAGKLQNTMGRKKKRPEQSKKATGVTKLADCCVNQLTFFWEYHFYKFLHSCLDWKNQFCNFLREQVEKTSKARGVQPCCWFWGWREVTVRWADNICILFWFVFIFEYCFVVESAKVVTSNFRRTIVVLWCIFSIRIGLAFKVMWIKYTDFFTFLCDKKTDRCVLIDAESTRNFDSSRSRGNSKSDLYEIIAKWLNYLTYLLKLTLDRHSSPAQTMYSIQYNFGCHTIVDCISLDIIIIMSRFQHGYF